MSSQTLKSISPPALPGKKRKRKREMAVNCDFSALGGCGSDNKNYSSVRPDFGNLVPVRYWSNYYKAIEWQQKHKVALWKSYALALQQENKYLIAQLRNVYQTRILDTPITNCNLNEIDNYKGFSYEQKTSFKNERAKMDSITNDDVTFEMSEEMIKFFERSIRHKLEMKKLKELKQEEEIVKELTKLQDADKERDKEMKMLYGDGNSMIIAMETAVQLSFEKYCDMKSPNYWPNIPFNM